MSTCWTDSLNQFLRPRVHENAECSHCLNIFEWFSEWRSPNPWHGIKAHPSYMLIFTQDTERGHPLCTWYWLQPLVSPFLSVRTQACHVFIHLSIQRGWLVLPCSPAQELSLGDSGQLCSPTMPCIPPDLPRFPCMPSLWAGRIVVPSDGATGIHPDSRPAIHPAIHAIERLTSCTPMAQNKASLWGTVVGFVPPPVVPCIPQTCPGSPLKAQGTGRSGASLRPRFPSFSAWCYRWFRSLSATSPSLHVFSFLWDSPLCPKLFLMSFLFVRQPENWQLTTLSLLLQCHASNFLFHSHTKLSLVFLFLFLSLSLFPGSVATTSYIV